MATNLENLQTAKSNILALIAALTLRPKPSYSIDGKSVSWTEYLAMLTRQLETINQLILAEDPFCFVSAVL